MHCQGTRQLEERNNALGLNWSYNNHLPVYRQISRVSLLHRCPRATLSLAFSPLAVCPPPPPFSLFSPISLPFTPSLQPSWHEACFYLAIDPPCCNMFVKTTALPAYQVGIKKKKKKNRLCCHCIYTDTDKEIQYLDTVSPLYLFHQPIPGQQWSSYHRLVHRPR